MSSDSETGLSGPSLPARAAPVPTTVSTQMQALIAAPTRQRWRVSPRTIEEWRARVADAAAETIRGLPAMREKLGVHVARTELGGVGAFVVAPASVAPENRDRLLMHLHGGCYMLNPGEAGLGEAILMAGFGRFKVISIDYRMPPEAYFPAALDDAMAGWKAVSAMADPKKMAIFGTSAGGALTLAMVLQREAGGSAAAGGDRARDAHGRYDQDRRHLLHQRNARQRAGLARRLLRRATKVYANGHDLGDPLLSPIYGDMPAFRRRS